MSGCRALLVVKYVAEATPGERLVRCLAQYIDGCGGGSCVSPYFRLKYSRAQAIFWKICNHLENPGSTPANVSSFFTSNGHTGHMKPICLIST